MRRHDRALVKEAFKTLLEAKDYDGVINLYESLEHDMKQTPLVRFLYADAIARKGDVDSAESILMEFAENEVPDIREGENSLSELYIFIMQKKAEREGKTLSIEEMDIPFCFDLRMNSNINVRKKTAVQ